MTWQPISTAPKNRTVLIGRHGRFIAVGTWKEKLNSGSYTDAPTDDNIGGGWTDFTVKSFAWGTFARLDPTHWMELPEQPPKVD